jgi:hypothetical protein
MITIAEVIEECAKAAADRYKLAPLVDQETCDECAAAIRARGEK